jgi:excinuclease UvrABC nuclease subunit
MTKRFHKFILLRFAKYEFNAMSQELVFQLGLSLIKGVGPVTAKKLIAYCGGYEAVFKEKISNLTIQSYRESYPKLSLVYNLHDV